MGHKFNDLKCRVMGFFSLFLSTTSIHGLTHLTGAKIHAVERILWLISFGLCLYGATSLSLSTWKRYQETPTVISMERNWKEWNTSFPSITLCPTEKYDEESLQNVLQTDFKNHNNTAEIQNFLIQLANATYFTFQNVPFLSTEIIPPSKYMELIDRIRYKLKYIVSNSNMEIFNISTLEMTITELGICYAYHSHVAIYNSYRYWASKNWTILPNKLLIERNPLDGDTFGQIMNMSSGYFSFIHSAMEVPDIAVQMLYSPSFVFKSLELTALSTYSTPQVRKLTVEQRKCRFLNESNLITSPVYTYRLCRIECRMKLADQLCGCVPHFYRPSYQFDICDVKGMHCLSQYAGTKPINNWYQYRQQFSTKQKGGGAKTTFNKINVYATWLIKQLKKDQNQRITQLLVKLKNPQTNVKVQCPCYLPCENTIYTVETNENMDWSFGTYIKWNLSKYPRMRLKRDILFSFTDVLVSVGGTFGLFLGSSVLSFLEIIYFFTLRLVLHILKI